MVYVYLDLTIVSRDALFIFVESQVANLSYHLDGAEFGAKVGGIVTNAETSERIVIVLCFTLSKLSYNFYMVPNDLNETVDRRKFIVLPVPNAQLYP